MKKLSDEDMTKRLLYIHIMNILANNDSLCMDSSADRDVLAENLIKYLVEWAPCILTKDATNE